MSGPTPEAETGDLAFRPSAKQKRRSEQALVQLDRLKAVGCSSDDGVVLFALDTEWNELDASELLEVGIAWTWLARCLAGHPIFRCHHLIVEENYHKRNGRYVDDHKDDYQFGHSEVLPHHALGRRIQEIIASSYEGARLWCLVGHSLQHDVKCLESLALHAYLEGEKTVLCDVALAHQADAESLTLISLSKLLDFYHVCYMCLHNAGNDAYYTLRVSEEMVKKLRPASLVYLDEQRS